MSRNRIALFIALSSVLVQSAQAGLPALTNLTTAEADKVIDNLGAVLYFRSVEPASSNGMIWGLGIGLVGSVTTKTQINNVTHQSGGIIPDGDLVATVQAPLGIALEVGYIPKVKIDSGHLKRASFNLKWTWTDVFPMPVNSALRIGYGTTSMDWHDSQANADYGVKSHITQYQLSVSHKLLFIEPYFGLGLLSQKSNISLTGSTPLAAGSYSYGRSSSSFWLSGGAEIRLLLLSLGAQIDRAFGETSGSIRIGFKI